MTSGGGADIPVGIQTAVYRYPVLAMLLHGTYRERKYRFAHHK